jgi:hypothetical protein
MDSKRLDDLPLVRWKKDGARRPPPLGPPADEGNSEYHLGTVVA